MNKKDTIVKAASELFAEKGYKETTTADIRKKADVAQGTLFYHFTNKEGILLHIFSEMIEHYLEQMATFSHDTLSGMEGLLAYERLIGKTMADSGQLLHSILPHILPTMLQESEETKSLFNRYAKITLSDYEALIRKGMDDKSMREVDPIKTAHLLYAFTSGISRYNTMVYDDKHDITETYYNFIESALDPRG